ncbi:MAG: histidine kinase [Alistipes senegalensis]
MVVFYTNYLGLIDRYLTTRRFGRFAGYNVLLIGAVMIGVHLLFRYVLPDTGHRPPMERTWQDALRFFAGNAVLYLLVLGAGVAIRMTGGWYRAEAARQELEHSRTEAELQNLKSQLNPHFLFNTLNNIYSLIQIDVDRAQRSVHELSSLLRYVLYESSRPTVPLKAEVEFLRDYIELMRIRQPRHVPGLRLAARGAEPDARRAAAVHFAGRERLQARGEQREALLRDDRHPRGGAAARLPDQEQLFPQSGDSDRSGSGIGLTNLSKRLEMIYPGRYTFEYGQAGDAYQALLCIELPDE